MAQYNIPTTRLRCGSCGSKMVDAYSEKFEVMYGHGDYRTHIDSDGDTLGISCPPKGI